MLVKYYSPSTSLLILRCARDVEPTVRAAITFIRQIKGRDVIVRVLHVGGESCLVMPIPKQVANSVGAGTIRKTQEAAIEYDRKLILKGRIMLGRQPS